MPNLSSCISIKICNTFLQILSLRYYGIVHKVDTKDYMQSLRDANELDKNDFCHSAYPMKMKKTLEVLVLYQLRQIPDPTSQFDDNNEIQDEKDDIQSRIERILLDIHMVPSRLERELRMVDLSFQTCYPQGTCEVSRCGLSF